MLDNKEEIIKTEITEEKIEKYFDVTGRAIKKIKISKKQEFDWEEKANDFLDMAQRYYTDAKYFHENNDFVNAFAALNYAHGWLDAGARLGLFDVGYDNILFTVDKEMFEKK
jgi:uncharacterized protein